MTRVVGAKGQIRAKRIKRQHVVVLVQEEALALIGNQRANFIVVSRVKREKERSREGEFPIYSCTREVALTVSRRTSEQVVGNDDRELNPGILILGERIQVEDLSFPPAAHAHSQVRETPLQTNC